MGLCKLGGVRPAVLDQAVRFCQRSAAKSAILLALFCLLTNALEGRELTPRFLNSSNAGNINLARARAASQLLTLDASRLRSVPTTSSKAVQHNSSNYAFRKHTTPGRRAQAVQFTIRSDSCEPSWNQAGQKCYRLLSASWTQREAAQQCRSSDSLGIATLATVADDAQYSSIRAAVAFPDSEEAWSGARFNSAEQGSLRCRGAPIVFACKFLPTLIAWRTFPSRRMETH